MRLTIKLVWKSFLRAFSSVEKSWKPISNVEKIGIARSDFGFWNQGRVQERKGAHAAFKKIVFTASFLR